MYVFSFMSGGSNLLLFWGSSYSGVNYVTKVYLRFAPAEAGVGPLGERYSTGRQWEARDIKPFV